MTPHALLAKIRISIPPEAVVPLLIGVAILLVLLFAGAKLADWKAKSPRVATMVFLIGAIALSGFVLYKAAMVLPEKYIDLGPPGHPPISLADGPVMGFVAIIATVLWRSANQRWIALGFGAGIGVALIAKPFVIPMVLHFSSGSERTPAITDPDTLSILGPGIAVLIAALIAGLRHSARGLARG